MKNDVRINPSLYTDIKQLIEEARSSTAQAVNAGLTMLYWNVGKRINDEILQNKRADYGKKIISTLSNILMVEYGKGWSEKQIRHCLRFVETFPEKQILSTLWRQLSWSHFKELIYFKNDLQREFYTQMCRIEQWSVRMFQLNDDEVDFMVSQNAIPSRKHLGGLFLPNRGLPLFHLF